MPQLEVLDRLAEVNECWQAVQDLLEGQPQPDRLATLLGLLLRQQTQALAALAH